MNKLVRLSFGAVLAAVLTAGCLPEGKADEKSSPDITGPAPSTTAPAPTPAEPGAPQPGATAPTAPPAPAVNPTAPNAAPTPVAPAAAGAEANTIKGTVRDEQGDPVAGARITAAGYTGTGANKVEKATSNASGRYRLPVVSGLYTVRGEATVVYEGRSYVLYLHPADNNCDQQMSAGGIVKDFVLRLSGLQKCQTARRSPELQLVHRRSGGAALQRAPEPAR
ncbi:MAG TPA: carboxypeptidase-like regulatory domain-containing protein [Acidimicrobiia bacterium]|nr:carboxypeptidase-like regulatory domain-containing protein [Acidimicrobiia bacterium]